ncbi:hypothetical protein ACIQ2D_15200 [Lysinibacillus sp. NPDC097287]|uniref:hypothetical protein n=1 Tax=Lysinibacillus sp. NPDC097287 TaxID=3364144 RepID=UPI0037FADF76
MKSIIAGLLSFIVGFMCYALTLKLVWNESLGGDAYAVLIWGGFFFLIGIPMYLFMISLIDESTRFSKHKYLFYPLGCMLAYFVPAAIIALISGGVSAIFSSELLLFHTFFLSSGFIFGITSWFFRRKESSDYLKFN